MNRTIPDFIADWAYESAATLKFIRALSEPSRNQLVVPGGRSLGFIAWHTVCAVAELGNSATLPVEGPKETSAAPATIAEMAAAYEAASRSFTDVVRRDWTDAMLADQIEMYGEHFTRGGALAMLVKHQAHHRGQMTVLMRQAGLRVPDVYGPAKEDWAQWGMPAHP